MEKSNCAFITSYERDNETNLDFAQARMYANKLGRFNGVDPLLSTGQPNDPRTWNRYSYVRNNPLRSIDPNGMYECKANKTQCDNLEQAINDAVKYANQYDKKSDEYKILKRALKPFYDFKTGKTKNGVKDRITITQKPSDRTEDAVTLGQTHLKL